MQVQVARQPAGSVRHPEQSANDPAARPRGSLQRAHRRSAQTNRLDSVLDLTQPHAIRGTLQRAVAAGRLSKPDAKAPAQVPTTAFRQSDMQPAWAQHLILLESPMSSAYWFGREGRDAHLFRGRLAAIVVTWLCASVLSLTSVGVARAQQTADAFDFEAADLGLLTRLRSPDPTVFGGIALTNRRSRNNSSADGSATVGLTFGDIDRTVSVRAAAVLTSLTDDFGDSGYFAISFSRNVAALGIPVEGTLTLGELAGWGDASENEQNVGLSFAVKPVYQTPRKRRIPIRLGVGAKAALSDLSQNQGFFLSAMAQWTPAFSTSAALIDGRLDVGAGLRFDNPSGGNGSFFVGVTAMDALDTDGFRRITLRTGFNIPIEK